MSAPFGRRVGVVTAHEELGPYVVLRVHDESGVMPRAGQFYMLAAVDHWGGGANERPFLPRACSILDVLDGELAFMLERVGPGTERLCELSADDELWLTGPLGNGFELAEAGVLVGGGVGIAPLALAQKELGGAPALLGFRDAHHALGGALLSEVTVATDDGSVGEEGYVTGLLSSYLDAYGTGSTVYACGPPAMLEAVRALCAERGVETQLALESPMACGFGACYGCVVATVEGYKRVCVDGPVFAGSALQELS